MLKNTLEFNAGVLALATVYAGNATTKRLQEKFVHEYNRMLKEYEKRQEAILKEIADNYINE